jgi:hypothetical protein
VSRNADLADVVRHIKDFGVVATLVTVTPDAAPHVGTVVVTPGLTDLELRVGPTTKSHIRANPSVTLTWLRDGLDYQLIVDGVAVVVDEAGDDGMYAVRVGVRRGILHRVAGRADGPSCRPLGAVVETC